jgi:hypothetical protein
MTIPDSFPPRPSRPAEPAAAPASAAAPGGTSTVPAAGSRPLLRGALLLCIAAQLITISALNSADPIPVTWAAVLLAVAPAPVAALAAFAPAPAARLAAVLGLAVLVTGIAGQVTHTGLFFIPALAAMTVATARLWRDR